MKKTITEVENAIENRIAELGRRIRAGHLRPQRHPKKNTRKPDGGTTLSQRSLRKRTKKRKRIGTTTAWRNG